MSAFLPVASTTVLPNAESSFNRVQTLFCEWRAAMGLVNSGGAKDAETGNGDSGPRPKAAAGPAGSCGDSSFGRSPRFLPLGVLRAMNLSNGAFVAPHHPCKGL